MKRLLSILTLITFIIVLVSCQREQALTFTDERDGNVYEYVQIGDQFWMKENLRFKPENGIYWAFGDNEARGDTFGFLYDWERACKVCPEGWHLATRANWDTLIAHLGGMEVASAQMKDILSGRWQGTSESIGNLSGFSALPEGVRRYDGRFSYYNKYAYFWTSTSSVKEGEARCFAIDGPQKRIHSISWNGDNALSVRCVKD